MYRWRLADEPLYPDRFGGFHEDRAQMRDTLCRGGQDETWWQRLGVPRYCPMCGKDLRAKDLCASCGDSEDMAA